MANICEANLKIFFKNEDEAKTFESKLAPVIEIAREKREAIFLGSSKKYLDVLYMERDGEKIELYGEVRWSLPHSEALEWTQYLCSLALIERMTIFYFECGCQLLGRYEFEIGQLTDVYVPDEFFPEYDEESGEYSQELDDAIEEHGIDVFVGEIAA